MKNNFMNSDRMLTIRRKGLAAAIAAGSVASLAMTTAMTTFATEAAEGSINLDDAVNPIKGLLESVLTYVIILVAAAGAIFCVTLGVKFARAEEPQEREKAKQHLKNAIIGYVLIFILVVALRVGTPILLDWMDHNS